MMEQNKENQDFNDKLLKGLDLAFERLLERKKINDESFIFYYKGKVVKVKARDFNRDLDSIKDKMVVVE